MTTSRSDKKRDRAKGKIWCGDCRHYFEGRHEGDGTCRRYAPRPMAQGDEWEWPAVMDFQWCGEFVSGDPAGQMEHRVLRKAGYFDDEA